MKKNILILLIVIAIPFWLSACKKAEAACNSSNSLCSCDLTATSEESCEDYEGMTVSSATSDCGSGVFNQTERCTTSSRVGTCKIEVGNSITYQRFYSDAVTHQVACEASNLGTGFLGAVEWIAD